MLDCDQDVDIDRDMEYKNHMSQQVKLYVDYVRAYMKARGRALSFARSENFHAQPFNGYYLTLNDSTVVYMDKDAPLMAHAVPASRSDVTAAAAPGGGLIHGAAASRAYTTLSSVSASGSAKPHQQLVMVNGGAAATVTRSAAPGQQLEVGLTSVPGVLTLSETGGSVDSDLADSPELAAVGSA